MAEKTIKEWLKMLANAAELANHKYYSREDIETSNNGDMIAEVLYDLKKTKSSSLATQEARYGGEGQGEKYYYVVKFYDKETTETAYIKFEGCYNSWNGVEWCDDPFFVEPKEKTIIVYEEKK